MYPTGKARELFEAISKINKFAYSDTVLLANHVLSKTPCGDGMLERYQCGISPRRFSRMEVFFKVLHNWVTHLAVFGLMLLARLAQLKVGLKNAGEIKHSHGPVTVVDLFILLHRVLDQKKYTDSYFPGLYEQLSLKGHNIFILGRLYGTRNPRNVAKAFAILKKHHIPIITEYELFTFSDWIALFKFGFVFPLKTLGLVKRLEQEEWFDHSAVGNTEFKISPYSYVRSSLIQCLSQNYMSGEARRLAARRLAVLLPEGSSVISWYENQVVDKCFYRGLRELRSTCRTFGAQLLTWPDSLLNNHADPSDILHGAAPDVVLVNGPYFLPSPPPDAPEAEHLASEVLGSQPYRPYPNGPEYRIGPALRYRDLFDEEIVPDKEKPVMMLLSYHNEETERVLALAKPLAEKGVSLALKFHPATNWRKFEYLLPAQYTMQSGALKSALKNVSLVVGSGSGALPEAVSMGVPAIAVDDKDGIGLNYLPEYGKGELWESICSADEFFKAHARLMSALENDPQGRSERIAHFRSLLFTEPTEERIIQAFEL